MKTIMHIKRVIALFFVVFSTIFLVFCQDKEESIGIQKVQKPDDDENDVKINRDEKEKIEENNLNLFIACSKGDLNKVKEIIASAQVNVNYIFSNGQTPLEMAAASGRIDIAIILLQHGADVNIKDMGGFTALHIACWNGHFQMVNLLLEHNADFTMKDQYGKTPLMYAQENGFPKIVTALKESGAKE